MPDLDWKDISHRVANSHNLDGESVTPLGEVPPFEEATLVNLSPDPFVVVGTKLRPKQDVRRWLFSQRHRAAFKRKDQCVIWSAYDRVTGMSFVGLGLVAERERAIRMHVRNTSLYRVVGTKVA